MFKTDRVSVKEVWMISWPLIVANSFWNLQLSIDRIMLGQFSTESLAASVAVTGLYWAPMALLQQTAAYVTTFVAQYLGAKEFSFIGKSFTHSIYIGLFGGLLFLIQIPFTEMLFSWVGHSAELQKLEVQYFQVLCFSALPIAIVASCSGFFTGLGRSKVIILINASGLVLNVFFDYIFIFGNWGAPIMGITGAGIATALANCGGAFVGIALVLMSKEGRLYKVKESWGLNIKLMKNFIKFGVPSGLQWALEGLAFTFFLVFIGRTPNGDAALAASSITVTIMLLALLPSIGVAQGVSALVGQYLGDNSPRDAVRVSWAGMFIVMVYVLSMAVTFVVTPGFYIQFFQNSDNSLIWMQVAEMVPYLLVAVAVFILFDSMNLIFSFALKGAGDTQFVSLVALVLPWPLMVVPTWVVSGQNNGVYWAWAFASLFIIVQAFVFLGRFLGGRWKTMRVI